jgi:hypothetical protein
MRTVTYKTHWSYAGKSGTRKAPLSEFVLDIVYLIGKEGVIPPFHVLNEVLQGGGNNGGMGPGTSWRPFRIKEADYVELVQALLRLDIAEARKTHPYVDFDRLIVDEMLHHYPTHLEWVRAVVAKYRPSR